MQYSALHSVRNMRYLILVHPFVQNLRIILHLDDSVVASSDGSDEVLADCLEDVGFEFDVTAAFQVVASNCHTCNFETGAFEDADRSIEG